MNKKILLFAFLLIIIPFCFAANPGATITSPVSGTHWKNASNSIQFTVMDADVNGLPNQDLNAKLWYSTIANGFENLIGDYNLMNTAYCGSADFNSATRTCIIAWDTNIAIDGNYFIDANIYNYDDGATIIDENKTSSASFVVDNTKPETTADYNAVWQSFDANVSFSCTDATSGCVSITVNGANYSGNTTSILFSSDGNNAVNFYSTDASGNVEDANTVFVLIDRTVPSINNFSPSDTNNARPTISFDLNDSSSGLNLANVNDWNVSIDGNVVPDSAIVSGTTHFSYVLDYNSADKNIVVNIDVSDRLGNKRSASIGFFIDSNAPTTTASGCDAGWNAGDKTISLSCSDASSGCQTTNYMVDDGSWSNGNSIGLTTDGNHKVEFKSTDKAQNPEATKTMYCAIDKTAPSVSTPSTSTSGRNATISWSATDSNSGVQLYYLFKGGTQIYSGTATSYTDTALSDGTYTYKVKAKDNVGNESGFSSEISVTISASSADSGSSSGGGGGSGNRSVWINLSISVSDFVKAGSTAITVSGDEVFEQGYQVKIKKFGAAEFKNIASATSYSGKSVTVNYTFNQGDDGNYSIVAVAWSSTGARAEKEKTIFVDTKAPNIELLSPTQNAIVSKTFELKANAADANSGMKQVAFYYRKGTSGEWQAIGVGTKVDANNWVLNWNTASLADSSYQLKATSMDLAGNTVEKIVDIKVSNIAALGIKGATSIEGTAEFEYSAEDLNKMIESTLKASFTEEAKNKITDSNVSRILKIIKVVDGNNVSYKASVFVSFRNNSSENVSVQLVEVIPKEFAENADAIESNEPFTVIENDPIIFWKLENIRSGKAIEIVYSLKAALTREVAMKLIDSNVIEKFSAPPIIVSAETPLDKTSFLVSLTSAPTGFFGLGNASLLAIILGIIVAAIAASALYFTRGGGFSKGESLGAKPADWTYKEALHKGITEKIGSALQGFIGSSQKARPKWVFKKDSTKELAGEQKGIPDFFKGLDFTIAKKTERQKPEGKAKWGFKEDNSDI